MGKTGCLTWNYRHSVFFLALFSFIFLSDHYLCMDIYITISKENSRNTWKALNNLILHKYWRKLVIVNDNGTSVSAPTVTGTSVSAPTVTGTSVSAPTVTGTSVSAPTVTAESFKLFF